MQEPFYEFVELPVFSKELAKVKDPDLLGRIQDELLKNPRAGALLGGGIRKVRVSSPARQGGKRGGYRVWYYFYVVGEVIFLLYLLDKREAENISKQQEQLLIEAVKRALP